MLHVYLVFRQLYAKYRASSALLSDLLDAPTPLAASCGCDLCFKYILYFAHTTERSERSPRAGPARTRLCIPPSVPPPPPPPPRRRRDRVPNHPRVCGPVLRGVFMFIGARPLDMSGESDMTGLYCPQDREANHARTHFTLFDHILFVISFDS